MNITSSAFENGETIPQKYGRDFENVNPPITIRNVPKEAKSLVLFMEDPDVPKIAGVKVWDHWVVFNIPSTTRKMSEKWNVDGVRGKGTRGELDYGGPRPPDREHRYFFRLYAIDTLLNLPEGSPKQTILYAMDGHILQHAELMGRFAPSANNQ